MTLVSPVNDDVSCLVRSQVPGSLAASQLGCPHINWQALPLEWDEVQIPLIQVAFALTPRKKYLMR